MASLRTWLRPPRNLLALFGVVIFVPTATLITLGVRLLDQDRALARQRQAELLERAADQGVRALSQDFEAIRKRLDGPLCDPKQRPAYSVTDAPDDSVWIVLRPDRFEAIPPERLPYFPRTPGLRELPTEPFREIESHEFARPPNLERALKISRELTAASEGSIQAGALVREARILRVMGRHQEALAAYAALGRIKSVSIGGEPAPLVARRARCAVLYEQSKTQELQVEAAALAGDLRSGTWQLDRETYFHVAGLLGRWLGSDIAPRKQDEALAAGVAWLYERWTGSARADSLIAGGIQCLRWNGAPVTIVWRTEIGCAVAFLGGPQFLEAHWIARLRDAVRPARAYLAGVGGAPPTGVPKAQRSGTETGWPWTFVVAGDGAEQTGFESRRRNLLAGMAAVLVLFAAASLFLWRSANRDFALAKLQADFVSAVSHEFRTPLTALRQFNDLLMEVDGPTEEKRRQYYEGLTRATERLYRLVESLLDFARMEAGRRPYRFERLDAGELAAGVAEEFQREADAFGFSVTRTVDPAAYPISGDQEALSRALWNLLDNAMKYSGAAREIEMEVVRAQRTVHITVRDRGIGVPPGEQKRIFDKFVRGAAAKSSGVKGTGLGLTIVRHIVEAHGGAVVVESPPGEGSAFTIILPVKEEA